MQSELEDNEALAAKEEALKELVDKEPKLLDMEIGPPFRKPRQQAPTEKAHHMQHPPQHLPQGFPTNMKSRPPFKKLKQEVPTEEKGHLHIQHPPQHLQRC